jgi:hypothetical protein
MAMSKTTNDIVWSGKTTEWDTFDRQVARWCRKKFANLGSWFWGDSPPELTFELQKKIFKIEKAKDFRSAQSLWESKEFWTLEYLEEWIEDGFSKTFDYVEEHVSGNAEKETVELGLDGIRSLRSRFITRYGGSTSAKVKTLERAYDAGLPKPGQQPFQSKCNMEQKLLELESMRNQLKSRCPKALRGGYVYGKDEKLVRIILEHISPEYQPTLDTLCAMHKMRLELKGGTPPDGVGIENFSDEWLPEYTAVYNGLIAAWETNKRVWRQDGGGSTKVPSMAAAEVRGGKRSAKRHKGKGDTRICFACQKVGHIRGDPQCKVQFNVNRQPKGDKGGKGGKGGKGTPGICWNFQTNGYCRWGSNCRFRHEGEADSGNTVRADQSEIAAMVASVLKGTLQTAIANKKKRTQRAMAASDDEGDDVLSMLMTIANESSMCISTSTIEERGGHVASIVSELHAESVFGVDTDSARSLSTNGGRFMALDTSKRARESVTMHGVGGGKGVCGGIGPMVVPLSEPLNGETAFLIDPDGVFVEKQSEDEPSFSVIGQQKMKGLGVALQQCYQGGEEDVLLVRATGATIKCATDRGILVLPCLGMEAMPVVYAPTALMIADKIRSGELPAVLTRTELLTAIRDVECTPSAVMAVRAMSTRVGKRGKGRSRV